MPAEHIRLPRVQELAARGAVLVEKFDAHKLPRIQPLLHGGGSGEQAAEYPLTVRLAFAASETAIARIELAASGEMALVCQRCLDPVSWQFDLRSELSIVADESELEASGDRFDALVVSDDGFSLRTVLEDELLAAMPLAPVHDVKETCGKHARDVARFSGSGEGTPGTVTPFGQLGELLSGKSGPADK
jgi:uncharacterized protein